MKSLLDKESYQAGLEIKSWLLLFRQHASKWGHARSDPSSLPRDLCVKYGTREGEWEHILGSHTLSFPRICFLLPTWKKSLSWANWKIALKAADIRLLQIRDICCQLSSSFGAKTSNCKERTSLRARNHMIPVTHLIQMERRNRGMSEMCACVKSWRCYVSSQSSKLQIRAPSPATSFHSSLIV